jgi:carboxyl-terminal processing protease
MTAGAIEGMLASLGDIGHTTYLSPDELKQLENSLEGHFTGIGARMTIRKELPTVVQVLPNSPALRAGIKPGDVLAKVNGKDIHAMPLARIVELVRGRPGTTVHIEVKRKNVPEPLDFEITRAEVPIENVVWSMLPGTQIAHLAIQEFGVDADKQLREALAQLKEQGTRGLIVDLRGNPGGVKDQAVAVTSEFLESGIVFLVQDVKGHRTEVPVLPGGVATEIPLCVLIDEGTASSAEIFAGAIQDYDRGTVIGTHSFGTGTVLRPFALSDGSAILLAVDEWMTPKGRVIWHQGIQPDIKVTLPSDASILMPYEEANLSAADLEKGPDKQLLEALKVMRTKIH